ncbi:MAG: deaminase [Chromatiales bacterium]
MTKPGEIDHMRLAIREARRSKAEDDRSHPYVGVVVVRENEVLASACRGDLVPGDHAEYTALEKKLGSDTLARSTVYTTLEPCTTRNHPKIPCADRLIQRRVGRVVIGALDPDQRITGQGVLRLRRAGIAVDLFPPELMAEVEELNRDFIRDREAETVSTVPPGVVEAGITAFYPCRDFYAVLRKDAATIDRYVSTAEHTVIMVSINLMTGLPFHDLCECLKSKLGGVERAFTATISLLDPRRPELMGAMAPVLNKESLDLAESVRRSVRNLVQFKRTLPVKVQSRLDVRVHPALPFGSAILLDHAHQKGRIQIETKPYKIGLQRSFAFEVARRSESGVLFDTLATAYEKLVADGQSVESEEI